MPEQDVAADMDMLIAIEKSIPEHTTNKVKHIIPCIHFLEDRGYKVDEERLSKLLRRLG